MARDYYDESKPKKKKKETPKPQKVTKSPSVTKVNNKASNSTFMGGGSSVKKVEQRQSAAPKRQTTSTPKRTTMTDAQYQKTYGEPRRATAQRTSTIKPEPVRRTTNHRLTAAQTQKMYGTTKPNLQPADERRREREEQRKQREERRLAAQRQKSGLNDQPTAAQKAAVDRAIKNTPGLMLKAGKDVVSGYGQTLTDVIERTASSERGTEAKAMKMGIEKGTKQYQELEEERKRTAEEARKDNQSLYQKMQERQSEWDEKTKNAKGFEKAYYGAVESGTGMIADAAIGGLTGTGQVGALASMGLRTYGSSANQARAEGATETEAAVYGLLQAGKEMGTEKIGGGGLAKMAYGKGALGLGDIATNTLIRNLKGQTADLANMGVRLLGDVAEENIEEGAGWLLDPWIKELTYGKTARGKAAMKERSNALRAEIKNEDDARSAAAYISSDDFIEQTKQEYMAAGMKEKEAEEVAERMRDYLTASLTGDTDSMEKIEDEVAKKVAGSHNVFSDYSFKELKETVEATTLLVAATGLPANIKTNIKTSDRGNLFKKQLGEDGIRSLATKAIEFEDSKMSAKARAMAARLESGQELTGTQAYELQAGMQEQLRKDTEREQSSRRMAARAIESNNLLTPYRQNQNGGIDLDEATEAAYRNHANRAGAIIDAIADEKKESITDTQKVDGSKAIAGFQTGVFTVEDANALNYSNTAIRSAFETATGINLGQYVVTKKNGEVDIPATNTKTKDALFAMAADNLVKSAQAETQNWMDNAKGQVVTQVSARMGAQGSAALQQALDGVDERDRSKYMMTTNAADMMYQAARNMGTEWSAIAPEATRMFPGIDPKKLEEMYIAGLKDRRIANSDAHGRQVKMGKALSEMGDKETATGKVFIDSEVPPKGTVIRTFTEIAKNLGADIHFVDFVYDKNGDVIEGANGSYDPNTNTFYLNVSTGIEQNVGYIFMHEMTHYLKKFAPEQYQALENLVRERWFAFNPSQMQDAIARKIARYAEVTKGQQVLTEEQALEEIIADASHDFINDPEFARQVAEEDMGLAKAILDSIRNALRMLRSVFASGSIDQTHMNSLFRELDILSEAEKLWLDAYKVAVQNSAAAAVDNWQGKANQGSVAEPIEEKQSFSISEPVERVKDLIAVHNIWPDDLIKSLDLGGLAMPSIAVTKDKMGHDKYGSISLLFDSDTIAPEFFRDNQVFGGDAYTPLFPKISYKHNEKVTDKISDLYYEAADRLGYDAVRGLYDLAVTPDEAINRNGGEAGLKERYADDISLMRTYLRLNDNDVEDVINRTETTLDPGEQMLRQHFIDSLGEESLREFDAKDIPNGKAKGEHRRQWVKDHLDEIKSTYKDFVVDTLKFSEEDADAVIDGMKLLEFSKLVRNALDLYKNGATTVKEEKDLGATNEAIRNAALNSGYAEWLDNLLTGIEEKKGIRNNREEITNNGRRSWEQLHDEITLENVVRSMKRELAAGSNGVFGVNPTAAAQKDYKNLDEIRADEDRLQQLPEEEYKALESAATAKMTEACRAIANNNPGRFDFGGFGAAYDVGSYVAEILNETRSKKSIQRKLKSDYSIAATNEQMDDLMAAIDEVANLPTGYFEAKPRRAVGFDEVKAAIIPQTMDEDIKAGLESRGVPFYEYDPEVEGNRTEVVNRAATEKNLRFSISENTHVMYTPKGVEVVQNPTDSEYRNMREEILSAYPWLRGTGEALLRKTYDESGNEYYWNAFEAMHSQVEPYINKEYNTRTSQQWKWYEKPDKDDYPIDYSALMARYSIAADFDEPYMDAVNKNELAKAQYYVDEAARAAGMKVAHRYHGTLNAGFTVFSKAKANVGGDSGAGFYFSTNEDDSEQHYSEEEGADNKAKIDSFADYLMEFEGEWNGVEIDSDETAHRVATEELAKNPGVYDVYLNYSRPYIRDHRNSDYLNDVPEHDYSTNIYDDIFEDFDESLVDPEDFENEDDYEEARYIAIDEHFYETIEDAVRSAYESLEENYEVIDAPDMSDLISAITSKAVDGSLTWDDIRSTIYNTGEVYLQREGWYESEWGESELTRAIIEGFGYDAIEDKEVGSKFGQLSRDMQTGTEHIIVFRPEQIKLADTVTYAEDGSVIPLSERFDPTNNDIRYSLPTQDSDGNILTDGQMEYFKNSQARDAVGRMQVVYHTTNNGGFTVFDPSYSDDKRSLFFASNWNVSQTYGRYADRKYRFEEYSFKSLNDFAKAYAENFSNNLNDPENGILEQVVNALRIHIEKNSMPAFDLGDTMFERVKNYMKIAEAGDVRADKYRIEMKGAYGGMVRASSYDELLGKLSRQMSNNQSKSGYYSCYLNLENPLIVDAQNQNWNNIPYGEYSEDAVLAIKNLTVQDMGNGIYVNIWGDRKTDGAWQEFRDSDTIEFEYLTVDGEYEIPEKAWDEVYDFLVKHGLSSDYAYEHSDAFFDFNGLDTFDKDGRKVESDVRRYRTRELAALAATKGCDGVIIRNCYDIGAASHLKGEALSDIFIAFSSNQVKDINNENPTENPDIRYSIIDDDEAMSHMAHDYAYDNSYEALAYYESLIDTDTPTEVIFKEAQKYIDKDIDEFYAGLTRYADGMKFDDPVLEEGRVRMARSKQDYFNSNIAKWNEAWLTDGEVLDVKSVKKQVKDLVTAVMQESDTTRKYRTDLVNKAVIDMRLAYFYAKKGRTDVADALLWHSAHRMIDGVEFYADDSTYEEYKGLRDYLKKTRIQLGEEYWSDADYGAFRKANFGRINLVQGSTNVDQIYAELEEIFPGLFDSEEYTTPPDQLLHIAEVLDSIQPYKEAYSSEQAAEFATDIASDLLEIMQNGKELQSVADKYKNRYEAKAKAMKARHAEAMLKVRQQREKGIKAEKAKFKEYVEKQKEKKAHNKYFDSINRSYKKLTERLLTNTADKNIPEQYKKELAKVLAAFDLQTVGSKKYEARTGRQGKKSIKMANLKVTLGNIENKSGEFHVSDAVTDIIDELLGKNVGNGSNRSIEGLTIDELNSSELARIDKLLKALIHEFNTYKTVKINTKRQQVQDIGKAQVESALEHAKVFGAGQDYYGFHGWVDRILNMDELTPAYLFRRIDPNKEGMALMYEQLEDSHDRYIRNTVQLSEWIDEIVGEYHHKGLLKKDAGVLEEWRSENYAHDFKLENGHTITLTPAQMMSVYCLSKRAQAYNHMTGAGIVVAPVSYNAKILSDLKKKAKVALPEMLTDSDIRNIVSKLDPDQVKVADKLQNLMADKMAAWGNEASMNVLGIELFGEPDYFPIKSDKAGLISDLSEDQFVEAIRSFGFTKAVQPGARNAIMVEDIFDVIAQHCNNMNLYNAYSEAINDFMKVYNYRNVSEEGEYTVKQAIGHAYSQKATNFIMSFMKDLNGNVSNGRTTGINDAFNDSLAKAKKASVFANIRVAAQQPTAIGRAFAVISPKYASAMLKPDRAILDEMFEHCPIAKWKSLGYYDINMGRNIEDVIMNNNNVIEEAATWAYGALDNLTWGGIWQMVKAETEDIHSDVEKGSDEYWNLCNRRMREVVAFTQVVDSPFHRSHAMRSKNFMDKLATAFGAEPTLTYNMVRDGYIRAKEMVLTGDKAGATKVFGRTMSVFVFTAGLTAAAAAFADVLRGKRPDGDDDDELTLLQLWWANTLANWKDNVNLLNNIYYVKDIMSLLDGWQINNLAFQGWKYIGTGLQQLYGSPYARSKDPWWKNMMYGVGYLSGMPIKTVMTDFGAIFNKAKEKLGFETPILDAYLESMNELSFQKDDAKASSQASMWSVIKENTVDKAAEKIGYKPIEQNTEESAPEQEGFLARIGVGKTTEEKEQDAIDKKANDIAEKTADLEGKTRDKKVWSYVTTYLKSQNGDKPLNEFIQEGDFNTVDEYRKMYVAAGGNTEYFDQRIFDTSKSAMKKTIVYDPTEEQIKAQDNIKGYLLTHGMDESELSEMVYKSDTAKDMKVAFRLNDKDLMLETLEPLVRAGLSYDDLERLWENRNRMQISSYKGRYKDKLKSTGNFIWPTDGQITSYFGYRNAPTAGASSNHPAIDIGAPMGAEVVAADGGVVIYAGTNGGYGNSVGIKHDNGMVTYYNHLSAWNVKVGDTVAQGQQIANVGSTGISTGPHLDFKILDADGEPVDPLKYLASRS